MMDALAVATDKRSDVVLEAAKRLKSRYPDGRFSQAEVREIARPALKLLEDTWNDDKEASHVLYDHLIGAVMYALGFGKMVERFDRKEKWYG